MNSLIAHAKTLVCKRLKTPIFPIPKAQGGGLLLAPNRWSLCLRRQTALSRRHHVLGISFFRFVVSKLKCPVFLARDLSGLS